MTDSSRAADSSDNAAAPPSAKGRLARDLALYTLARLGLVVLIAALILGVSQLINVDVPLLVALIFAVVIALPLSLVLFKSLRTRVNMQISAVDEQRRRDRDDLRAKLRGDATGDK
ncbi:DUF4229 domain-containing protein [Rhodococcus spelaei]|uniref:DUF4229 domain-containing protein n=1 Tax=Rhodococcus spelaei TaxID=2546320 RepID=A0A541B8K8_9NOCA|nr:DUF4229 domain-containing protein [Rhodococcus spelaei]TQF68633.1 DUF4229 domain-containing protein [Rhodococcus spelaei]